MSRRFAGSIYNADVRSVDEGFRDLVAARGRDEAAAEQLSQAARVLAESDPPIRSITCVRRVRPSETAGLLELARRLGEAYGLTVEIDRGDTVAIRFSRPYSVTSR